MDIYQLVVSLAICSRWLETLDINDSHMWCWSYDLILPFLSKMFHKSLPSKRHAGKEWVMLSSTKLASYLRNMTHRCFGKCITDRSEIWVSWSKYLYMSKVLQKSPLISPRFGSPAVYSLVLILLMKRETEELLWYFYKQFVLWRECCVQHSSSNQN